MVNDWGCHDDADEDSECCKVAGCDMVDDWECHDVDEDWESHSVTGLDKVVDDGER